MNLRDRPEYKELRERLEFLFSIKPSEQREEAWILFNKWAIFAEKLMEEKNEPTPVKFYEEGKPVRFKYPKK